MHGRVLFEEIFLVNSLGIALHGERPSRQMRQQRGRNAGVEIHHLTFGETGGRIEDFFEIRELELAALHFDDGGSRHGSSVDGGQWTVTSGSRYRAQLVCIAV